MIPEFSGTFPKPAETYGDSLGGRSSRNGTGNTYGPAERHSGVNLSQNNQTTKCGEVPLLLDGTRNALGRLFATTIERLLSSRTRTTCREVRQRSLTRIMLFDLLTRLIIVLEVLLRRVSIPESASRPPMGIELTQTLLLQA